MCLDIPPIANDILRITKIFSLVESILYFNCSVKKKKIIFLVTFLVDFYWILMIVCSKLINLCVLYVFTIKLYLKHQRLKS